MAVNTDSILKNVIHRCAIKEDHDEYDIIASPPAQENIIFCAILEFNPINLQLTVLKRSDIILGD